VREEVCWSCFQECEVWFSVRWKQRRTS